MAHAAWREVVLEVDDVDVEEVVVVVVVVAVGGLTA